MQQCALHESAFQLICRLYLIYRRGICGKRVRSYLSHSTVSNLQEGHLWGACMESLWGGWTRWQIVMYSRVRHDELFVSYKCVVSWTYSTHLFNMYICGYTIILYIYTLHWYAQCAYSVYTSLLCTWGAFVGSMHEVYTSLLCTWGAFVGSMHAVYASSLCTLCIHGIHIMIACCAVKVNKAAVDLRIQLCTAVVDQGSSALWSGTPEQVLNAISISPGFHGQQSDYRRCQYKRAQPWCAELWCAALARTLVRHGAPRCTTACMLENRSYSML